MRPTGEGVDALASLRSDPGLDPPASDPDVRPHVEVAVVDAAGLIIAVNPAWEQFCLDNGGRSQDCGPGVSYLAVCEAAAQGRPDDGRDVRMLDVLRAALRGELMAPRRLLLPCHAPDRRRWFETMVASRYGDDGEPLGATITLSEVPVGIDEPDVGSGGPRPAEEVPAAAEASVGEWALLDAMPDGLLIVDGAGQIVWLNAALCELSGHRRADLAGSHVERLVPPRSRAGHPLLRRDYASAPSARTMGEGRTTALCRSDGRQVPVEVALRVIGVGGEPMVLAAVRDVSDRIRAAEREQVVTAALDSISDGVTVVDPRTGHRLYANQAALEYTGYTGYAVEQLRHLPVGSSAGSAEQQRIQAAIEQVVSGATSEATLTTRIHPSGGHQITFEVRVTRVRGPSPPPEAAGGESSDLVVLVGRDIRGRLAAQARLETSEALMSAVFERTPVAAFLLSLDADGRRRFLRVNTASEDLLGVPRGTLAGQDVEEFLFEEDKDTYRSAGRELAAGRRGEYAGERRMRRTDGGAVWADLHLAVVDLPEVGTTLLGHMVDVTSRHQMERLAAEQSAMNALRAQVAGAILAGRPMHEVYELVVTGVAELFEAENVTLGYPDETSGEYRVIAATGAVGAALAAGAIPVDQDFVRRLAAAPQTRFGADEPALNDRPPHGPGAAARFEGDTTSAGLIVVVRRVGAPAFEDAELDLLGSMGRQVQVAIELGTSRADRQRLAVLEDRQRIARDLHDTVIQDLIALGMQLGIRIRHEPDAAQRAQIAELEALTEKVVRRLRGTVFDLRDRPDAGPLSREVPRLLDEAARVLGHRPALSIRGPVDDLSAAVADALVAVVREALSNVARHAHARATSVVLSAEQGSGTGPGNVCLVVEDDGVGLSGDALRGDGLDNVRSRAADFGGTATWTRLPGGGARLTWTCPVYPAPDPPRAKGSRRRG